MPNSITIVIIAKIRAKKEQLSSSSEKKIYQRKKFLFDRRFIYLDLLLTI